MDGKPKKTGPGRGRPPKHGGYTIARRDEVMSRRPEVVRYIDAFRRDIIADLSPEGEEHLTAARRCILDRLISKLATARLIECYLGEHGILRRDRLEKQKILEGEPIINAWLSINNQIREDIKLLGLERRALEADVIDLEKIKEEYSSGKPHEDEREDSDE